MRITAGKIKNRIVECPPGVIRPAMDRMRESMFSILGNIEDLSFLDLFSGSALVGLEAYSRGCSKITCVEMDRGKKKVIEKNLSMADQSIKLYLSTCERFISMCKTSYDIIYLDPPFPMKYKENLIKLISKNKNITNENTIVIIHYPSEDKKELDKTIGRLKPYDNRKYGRSLLTFYEVENV